MLKIGISDGLDYYPFGMLNAGRNWESGVGYRYGFSGKENEDEIAGNNNDLDFGARTYDTRLGRWFSVDRFTKEYTPIAPYASCLNNPIIFKDGDGRVIIGSDGQPVTYTQNTDGTVTWSSNATKDVQTLGNALITTPTGKEALDFMISQSNPTEYNISIDKRGDPKDSFSHTFISKNNGENETVTGTDGKTYYKSVEIVVNKKSIEGGTPEDNRFMNADGTLDLTEAYNGVMIVEAGHTEPDQIEIEKDMDPNKGDYKPSSENFVTIYNPLMNKEIKSRLEYRKENNGVIDETLYDNYQKIGITIDDKNSLENNKQ